MLVYRIVSPSGKSYIGITSKSAKKRSEEHFAKARKREKAHPFYDAIRKYGEENFKVAVLVKDLTVEDAKEAEQFFIMAYGTTDRAFGYNISPGGDYDAHAGSAAAWESIRSTPERYAEYCAKLSASYNPETRKPMDADKFRVSIAAYRNANPEAVKAAGKKISVTQKRKFQEDPDYAAKVLATIAVMHDVIREDPERHKALAAEGLRRAREANPDFYAGRSDQIAKVWASRDDEARQAIADKISVARKEGNATLSEDERAVRGAQLAEARKNIDHTYRKARQKEAFATYWTPERRAEAAERTRQRNLQGNFGKQKK